MIEIELDYWLAAPHHPAAGFMPFLKPISVYVWETRKLKFQ